MEVNEVNDPTWVERKAQFAFKFWKFGFFQQIPFNPTLIIGNAQPDFYQKNCSVVTLPPSPIQWLTQTGPWVPSLTPFKPLESELSLKTRRKINYKHVKIADDKSIWRLWKHQISIYNGIVAAWFACSWLQIKFCVKDNVWVSTLGNENWMMYFLNCNKWETTLQRVRIAVWKTNFLSPSLSNLHSFKKNSTDNWNCDDTCSLESRTSPMLE